jgi:hypothetical protein
MAKRFTIIDTSCCTSDKFDFISSSGETYNLSHKYVVLKLPGYNGPEDIRLPYLDVNLYGGITNFLNKLNTGNEFPDLKWLVGTFESNLMVGHIPLGTVKILPIRSVKREPGQPPVYRSEIVIDNEYVAQAGGSLYDNKGKLLYRGEMKNGLPHGYGTGYYANGKVGHVGMFKGGKIVQ